MSHVIEVPGGTVEFHDSDELTVRMQRPVDELSMQLGDLISRIARGGAVTGAADSDAVAFAPDVEINERQSKLLARFNDVVTYMWLKSWQLDGDIPFPSSADGLLDLHKPVYDAISKHAGELYKADMEKGDGGFELSDATVNDTNSPTGVSDGSATL